MIFEQLIPAALANHLWQSTLFAAAVALLVFALRGNRAQTRYALWLIASLKFLIPFSIFISIGAHLPLPVAAPVAHAGVSNAAVSSAVEISRPFIWPVASASSVAHIAARGLPGPSKMLPIVLGSLWLCGFLAVVFCWLRRWLRLRTNLRAATPLALPIPIRALSSPFLHEPGVFGIFRPVLLLPAGITNHLAAEHLEAIFTHELCHVRRRDNFFAAVHMLIEAIFWFHPLIWWIGARLVEERERACDEEVLRLGNRPNIYAESILKTCQFYLESPLACMSGVTGSNLKQRIVRIMAGHIANRLDFRKKLLLGISASAAIALPIAIGFLNPPLTQAQSPSANQTPAPSFEVASIKPHKSNSFGVMLRIEPGGRFAAEGIPLKLLIEEAYNIKDQQLSGDPAWLSSERYDIEAKADEETSAQMQKMKPDERKDMLMRMMQSLLADRCKLQLSRSTKELPVYALVVGKNGPKMKKSDFDPSSMKPPDGPPPLRPDEARADHVRVPGGPPPKGAMMMGPGHLNLNGVSLERFADVLSRILRRTVVDKTGLPGTYEFSLNWTPDENEGPLMPGGPPPRQMADGTGAPGAGPGAPPGVESAPPDTSGPDILTAIQEQLGLKLESQKGPVELLVIEHVEKPSQN